MFVCAGKRVSSPESDEQTLYVKQLHIHPLYLEEKTENDLAVIELRDKIIYKKKVVSACLPERDFAESLLMSGEYMGMVTGWKDAGEFEGNLRLNHLSYSKLQDCETRHSGKVKKFIHLVVKPVTQCNKWRSKLNQNHFI